MLSFTLMCRQPAKMLDPTKEKIKKSFAVICSELTLTDEEFEVYINLIEPMLSEQKFGKLYITAFVYLIAHHVVLRKLINSADGGNGTGASDLGIVSSVTSEKEGDLQRSYGSAASGNALDLLEKTYYGLEFKRIRAMCIIPVVTRLDLMV